MTALLTYDISSDAVRLKVADACLDYGLTRIQYSVFLGEISGNHLEELLQRIQRLTGKSPARVDVFPICEKDLKLRRTLQLTRLGQRKAPGRPASTPIAAEKADAPDS